jgi:hypothetical protein
MFVSSMSLKEMGMSVDEYLDLLEGPAEDELIFLEKEYFQEKKKPRKEEVLSEKKKQARYNVYAGYVRHRLYKEQGGKNPIYIEPVEMTQCNKCGEEFEILTKEDSDFAEENMKALLNLYDWAGYCRFCEHYFYGYFKTEEAELLKTEPTNDLLETENLPVAELVSAAEEVAATEETATDIVPMEEASPIQVEENTPSTDEIPPIDVLRRMKYVELAALANGRIPNFRRMKKEELILSLGGNDEEKSRTIERVRIETKRRYGSLKDKEEEVPTPIVSPANEQNLVRFSGEITPLESLKDGLRNLKERAMALLQSEQTIATPQISQMEAETESSDDYVFTEDWEKNQMTIFDYLASVDGQN